MSSEPRTRLAQLLVSLLLASAAVSVAWADELWENAALTLSKRIEVDESLLGMSPVERRRYAVSLAREDRLQTSVNVLEAMHRARPADSSVLHDLASVLSWQEQHQRVMQLSVEIDSDTAPAYALEAVARSARGTGQYELAEKWYRLAQQRAPERSEAMLGLALTLADAGDHKAAREIFAGLPSTYRSGVDGELVDAYLWQRQGDPLMALLSFDRALGIDPANRTALRGKLRALQDQLLPQQALSLAARHPGLASRDEIARLEADRAALWVRWGEISPMQGEARYDDADQALALLDANARRFPAATDIALVTRFDRILALRNRGLFAATIAAYEEPGLVDRDLPVYVLRAAAGAYLAERRPTDALRLYDIAASKAPGNFQLDMERFYALVELERHGPAMALVDQLVESQIVWLSTPGSRVIKPNPERLRAEIARALSRAYADQLTTSQSMLEEMLREAPHNTDVRQELGSVYRWRGWPRRAAFEYRQVLSVEPELLIARIGHAHALLDLQGQSSGQTVQSLLAEHPEDPAVKRLVRRHELLNRNEITVAVSAGESSGEQLGSRYHQADVSVYLRPINDNWRPYVQVHDASAEFSEGDAERRRAGLGVEYRRPNHRLAVGVTASLEGASRAGMTFGYTWEPTDFWQLQGLLESETHAMPLRGYRVGVDAKRLHLGARYRFSELGEIALAGDLMDFSDGNLRSAWLLNARRRVLNLPAWKIDLSAGLYASRNDLTAVSYFSPSSDHAASISLDSRWRLFRRYDRSFSQRLGLSAGRYGQSGFAADYVGAIEYEHMLELSDALELFYGVRRSRALYDGSLEYGTTFTGGLRGRF